MWFDNKSDLFLCIATVSLVLDIYRNGFIVSASLEIALGNLNAALIPSPSSLYPTPASEDPRHSSRGGSSGHIFTNTFSATFLPFGAKLKRGTKLTRRPYADLLQKVADFGPEGKIFSLHIGNCPPYASFLALVYSIHTSKRYVWGHCSADATLW